MLVVRVESGLFYFNVEHVLDHVRRYIATTNENLQLLVWDLSSSPYVDIAGARMLATVQGELSLHGAKLRLVDARAAVRDLVRAEVGHAVGEVARRISIDDVLREEGLEPSTRSTSLAA